MPTAIRRLLQFAAVSLGVALAVGGVPSYAAPTEQTLAEVPTEGSSTNSVAAGDDVLLARIPFEVDRNRTILKVQVGGSRPLRLILDTGMPMDGVYLFHKELQGEIALENAIEVLIPGAGGGEPSKGVMAESVPVSSGDVVFGRQRAIVSLSEQTQGFPTDGVIGWSLFGHYAVELDYDKMLITLHPSGTFAPDSSWHAIPMKLRKSIPWVTASVDVLGAGSVPVECYIDFASGEAVELLVHSDAKFPIPENLETTYLGTGLSGDVHGGMGRVASFTVGSYTLSDVPAAFPHAATRSKQEGADGIIGNQLLRRFNLVFDYDADTIWIAPNEAFDHAF